MPPRSKDPYHPHEIVSPHVMRVDEIRYWLRELSTNPAYGWTDRGLFGLQRALGAGYNTFIRDKLEGWWIWPSQQVRLTARINEILEGRIVPRKSGNRTDGVYVDPPQPPVVHRPRIAHMKLNLAGKLTFHATDMKPKPLVPNVRDAFKEVRFWDPTARRLKHGGK